MSLVNNNLKNQIKSKAFELGFDTCGFTEAIVDEEFKIWYKNYLKLNLNGNIQYLNIRQNQILNPQISLSDAKSVISFTVFYQFDDNQINPKIARYAQVNDYHVILKEKAKELVEYIKFLIPESNALIFVDSGSFPEKYFAAKAGIGYIGKNRLLINPKRGSFQFIGAILTNIQFSPDTPLNESCGTCSMCIDACPVEAITDNGINANLCLSYHSIENKNHIPANISTHLKSRWFGCDICQEVCPMNKFFNLKIPKLFQLQHSVANLDLNKLKFYSEEEFENDFKNTAIARTGLRKLKNNAGC